MRKILLLKVLERINNEGPHGADGVGQVQLRIRIPQALFQAIEELAVECECSAQQFAEEAVECVAAARRMKEG